VGARRRLRTGFTTGACAAAAAQGATLRLLDLAPGEATLHLPWGSPDAEPARFPLVGCAREGVWVSCGVIKDAGDDPDVTDGVEIRASVAWGEALPREGAAPAEVGSIPVTLEGGRGVGRVTKPGLAVAVGGPAINPVPREMIVAAVRDALRRATGGTARTLRVVVSVPRGEEIAKRTLNARLGILGGISILGTTGVVIPMSADAWRATLDAALDVARASGASRVILAHGRSSETAAQTYFPQLPPEAFILMGDHVGYALEAAADRGLGVLLAGQFAKFCKVAAGSFETHVKDSTLDLEHLADLLGEAGFPETRVLAARRANTAREIFQDLRAHGDRGVFAGLSRRVARRAADRVGRRVPVEAALFGYDKALLAREAA